MHKKSLIFAVLVVPAVWAAVAVPPAAAGNRSGSEAGAEPSQENISAWISNLEDADPQIRLEAARNLLSVAGDTTNESSLREKAVNPLRELAGPEVVDDLLEMWFASDTAGKEYGSQILRALADRSPETAVPRLLEHLNEPRPTIRFFVIEVLGSIDTEGTDIGSQITPALLAIVEESSESPIVRQAAAAALGKLIGANDVEALLQMWFESDPGGKDYGKQILRQLAQRSPETAVPALLEHLHAVEPTIRLFVMETLGSIELKAIADSAATSALLEIVKKKDENPIVRQAAVSALGNQPELDAAVTRVFVATLLEIATTRQDAESLLRETAVAALARWAWLDPAKTKEVVAALFEILNSKDEDGAVRKSAAAALGKLADADLVGNLLDMWFESDGEGKAFAEQILRDLAFRSPETALPALFTYSRDDRRPTIRLFAIKELGSIDLLPAELRSAATSALLEIVTSEDEVSFIKKAAADALGKLVRQEQVASLIEANTDAQWLFLILNQFTARGPEEAVGALLPVLTDHNQPGKVRVTVADVLAPLATIPPQKGDMISEAGSRVDTGEDASDTLRVIQVKTTTNPDLHVRGKYGTLDWDRDGRYTYTPDYGNDEIQGLVADTTLTDVFSFTILNPGGSVQYESKELVIKITGTELAGSVIGAFLEVVQNEDDEFEVRQQAAFALAQLWDENQTRRIPEAQLKGIGSSQFLQLLGVLRSEQDPFFREHLARALVALAGAIPQDAQAEQAAAELIAIADDGQRTLVGMLALDALGELIVNVRVADEQLSNLRGFPSEQLQGTVVAALLRHLEKVQPQEIELTEHLVATLVKLGQPALVRLSFELQSSRPPEFHSRIVQALGKFRAEQDAIAAIGTLRDVLANAHRDPTLRIKAAESLASLGRSLDTSAPKQVATATAKALLPIVKESEDSENSFIRDFAALALASFRGLILDDLLSEFKSEQDSRERVALVLAKMCLGEDCSQLTRDQRLGMLDALVRVDPSQVTEEEGRQLPEATRFLIGSPQEFGGKEADAQVRIVDTLVIVMTQGEYQQAAEAELRNLGPLVVSHLLARAKPVAPDLPEDTRKTALLLCDLVGPGLPEDQALSAAQRKAVIAHLEGILARDAGAPDRIAATIKQLKAELRRERFWSWITGIVVALAAYVALCLGIWTVIYIRNPLFILRFDRLLAKSPIPRRVLRGLLFVWVFEYRDRVLDAWVGQHVGLVREAFGELPTVQDRSIHVPTPVEFQPIGGRKSTLPALLPQSLQDTFCGTPVRLLLLADGGSGKTSLACQIAKWAMSANPSEKLGDHRMLPVLVEQELKDKSFADTIRDRLTELVGGEVPPQLFARLLARQRLLVIFDRFSEMNDETQKKVAQVWCDRDRLSVGSLLVTSRNKKELENCDWTVVEPLFIKGDRLSSFMEGYLLQRDKRKLFADAEFFELCRRLSLMVGKREITALFGKLYAEQLITAKSKRTDAIVSGPDSIPNLIKAHLKNLYNEKPHTKIGMDRVQGGSQQLAWACLRKSFRPGTLAQQTALEALDNDADLLAYLVDDRGRRSRQVPTGSDQAEAASSPRQIGLVQRVGENQDSFRFILDPMAEYLAGLHLVEAKNRNDDEQWLDFLKDAEKNNPQKTRGFLLAVRDCCLAAKNEVPDRVPNELAKLAGLSIREIEQDQRTERIRRNVANLDLPAAEDRVAAAQALGSMGPEAEKAVPALLRALRDRDGRVRAACAAALAKVSTAPAEIVPEIGRLLQDEKQGDVLEVAVTVLGEFAEDAREFIPELCSQLHGSDNKHVRQAAATALGKIGTSARQVAPELIKALSDDDWDLAESASSALGQMGAGAVQELTQVLKHEDELVRWRAAKALAAIGPEARDAVPALTVALEDEDWSVRKSAAVALGRMGPAASDAVDVLKNTMDDPEESVAESAAEALQHICPEMELESRELTSRQE